jgi:hypothetical protein
MSHPRAGWSANDLSALNSEYPRHGASMALQRTVGRPKAEIRAKAVELGLPEPPAERRGRWGDSHERSGCGQPCLALEPDDAREEARRSRARQLAELLADGPVSKLEITTPLIGGRGTCGDAGSTREALEAILADCPSWFALCGWGLAVELSSEGRKTLLGEESKQ